MSNIYQFPTEMVREDVYIERLLRQDRPVRVMVQTSLSRQPLVYCSETVHIVEMTDDEVFQLYGFEA